ncbi:hypothetical protein AGLY_012744 [Aphis glycines]|uniref:CCHC-type domain-containing protein n=1 Tax=Aphis glycines TaxID=307491 RepID=A0A6G0T855_APHGL|nr:hypothetical protein AGLY_012744 [Aphis glycines]
MGIKSEQAGSTQSLFSEWQKNGPNDWQRNITMKAELQAVQSAIKMLELQLVAQDGGLKLLFQRVEHFELSAKEMHSPTVSTAISEILEVVGALRDSRECVNKAFNELTELTMDLATMATSDQTASESLQTPATRTSTVDPFPEASSEQGTSKENQQENRGNRGQRAQQQQVASNSKSAEKSVLELDLGIQESWYTMVQNEEEKNSGKAVAENLEPSGDTQNINRRCLPKTQTVVPDNLSCMSTYADMVEDIKDLIRDEELDFGITTEWSKSGDHLVLTTSEKDNAVKLSNALRKKFGQEKDIRRPSPSISLLLIGIEDSVDVDELTSTLEALDKELIAANKLTIKKGLNGVRTVTVRVPRAPGLRLVQAKKIKVGRAICRVKELVTRQRCAKCSAPDHTTADCTGQETRKCFRCKKTGHLIAACDLPHSSSTASQSSENLGAEEQRKKTPTE